MRDEFFKRPYLISGLADIPGSSSMPRRTEQLLTAAGSLVVGFFAGILACQFWNVDTQNQSNPKEARKTLTNNVRGSGSDAPTHDVTQVVQDQPAKSKSDGDEAAIAKAIIDENASWIFAKDKAGQIVHDEKGQPQLTPLGLRYASYITRAQENGITTSIAQHTYAVNCLLEEARQARANGRQTSGVTTDNATPSSKDIVSILQGCVIVAKDGRFLGKISTSTVERDSILNEVGPHGSQVGSESIFCEVSKYGGEIGSMSPFSEICFSPPGIYNSKGRFIAFLTVNTSKTPRIDPRVLVALLKSS